MIQTFLTSQPGTALGITRMLAAMQDYRDQLLFVLKVRHRESPRRYTFVAIFREQGSVGGFTALIDQGGATSGYDGAGPWAYAQMMSFIEDNHILHGDVDWNDLESDFPNLTGGIKTFAKEEDWAGLAEVWGKLLSFYMWNYLPHLNYEPSDEWVERARGVDRSSSG